MRVLSSGRNSFEVAILTACLLYGLVGLVIFDRVATTTIRLFPTPFGHLVLGALASGALVALVGVARGDVFGVLLERAGMLVLLGSGLAYGLWAIGSNGLRGFAFASFLFAVAAASAGRIWQIQRDIGGES
jgi:hypothetical protein